MVPSANWEAVMPFHFDLDRNDNNNHAVASVLNQHTSNLVLATLLASTELQL